MKKRRYHRLVVVISILTGCSVPSMNANDNNPSQETTLIQEAIVSRDTGISVIPKEERAENNSRETPLLRSTNTPAPIVTPTPYPVIAVEKTEGIFHSAVQFSVSESEKEKSISIAQVFYTPPPTLWYKKGATAGWEEKETPHTNDVLVPGEYIAGEYIPNITNLPKGVVEPTLGTLEIVPLGGIHTQSITDPEITELTYVPQELRIRPQTLHRPLLVFLPGSGHETAGKFARFDEWSEYAAIHEKEIKALGDPVIVRYASHKDILENAASILKILRTTYGPREIYIVAHSMGGLIAKGMALLDRKEQLIRAIITLGTPHHGSQLAIPKLPQEVFSRNVGGDIYYALYMFSMSRFSALTENYSWKKMRKLYYESSYAYLPAGSRGLFFDGSIPRIPSINFFFSIGVGIVPLTPLLVIPQSLSPEDHFGIRCDNPTIQNDKELASLLPKYSNASEKNCLFNMAEFLNGAWDDLGIKVPIVTYVGTVDHSWSTLDLALHIDEITNGNPNDNRLAHDGLRWLGNVMAQMPTNTERDRKYGAKNDGMVTRRSQMNARPDCAETAEEDGAAPETCLPPNYRMHYWEGYDHLDLTKGKAETRDKYFTQWCTDIAALEEERGTARGTLPPTQQIRDTINGRYTNYATNDKVLSVSPIVPKDGIVTVRYRVYTHVGPTMSAIVTYEGIFSAIGTQWLPVSETKL